MHSKAPVGLTPVPFVRRALTSRWGPSKDWLFSDSNLFSRTYRLFRVHSKAPVGLTPVPFVSPRLLQTCGKKYLRQPKRCWANASNATHPLYLLGVIWSNTNLSALFRSLRANINLPLWLGGLEEAPIVTHTALGKLPFCFSPLPPLLPNCVLPKHNNSALC